VRLAEVARAARFFGDDPTPVNNWNRSDIQDRAATRRCTGHRQITNSVLTSTTNRPECTQLAPPRSDTRPTHPPATRLPRPTDPQQPDRPPRLTGHHTPYRPRISDGLHISHQKPTPHPALPLYALARHHTHTTPESYHRLQTRYPRPIGFSSGRPGSDFREKLDHTPCRDRHTLTHITKASRRQPSTTRPPAASPRTAPDLDGRVRTPPLAPRVREVHTTTHHTPPTPPQTPPQHHTADATHDPTPHEPQWTPPHTPPLTCLHPAPETSIIQQDHRAALYQQPPTALCTPSSQLPTSPSRRPPRAREPHGRRPQPPDRSPDSAGDHRVSLRTLARLDQR
jgi:hypothetical protein